MAESSPREGLRILIVTAEPEIAAQVEATYAAAAAPPRVYWVAQLELTLTRALDVLPQIALVDMSAAGPAALALVGDLVARVPQTAVIALVHEDQLGLSRDAVLAGARGFLTIPVESDELASVIRQVVSQPAQRGYVETPSLPAGRMVVFSGPKGGTGRTTLAINTAMSIQELARRPVVLVDADYAAPAVDVALNLRPDRTIKDLLPRMARIDPQLLDSVLTAHPSGLRLLLAGGEGESDGIPSIPQVEQLTAWLRRLFPWVAVDLGLPINEMAHAFLDAADRVVVSINPEMVGLRNARLMLDQLHLRGYPPDKVWLVVNRNGLSGGLKLAELEEWLGYRARYLVPNDQVLATMSINRGVPLIMSGRRSAVARSFRGLAQELIESLQGAPAAATATVPPAMPVPLAQLAGEATSATPARLAPETLPAPEAGVPGGVAGAAGAELAREQAGLALSRPAEAELEPELTVAASGAADTVPVSVIPAPPTVQLTSEPAVENEAAGWLARLVGRRDNRLRVAALILAVAAVAGAAGLVIAQITGGGRNDQIGEAWHQATATLAVQPVALAGKDASTPVPSGAGTSTAILTASVVATVDSSDLAAAAAAQAATGTARAGSATALVMPSSTPTPTAAETPTATAMPTDMPTSTPRPSSTPTRAATARPRPSATPVPPSPTPQPPQVSIPSLLAPAPNETRKGVVEFKWQPTGPLPAGAGYEVVWWNAAESPGSARGIAPPTTASSLSANIDVLYSTGQLNGATFNWTVLIVQTNPYLRLTDPAASNPQLLTYEAGGAPPPPPKPR